MQTSKIKNIIIIGVSGYIGLSLSKKFIDVGIQVSAIVRKSTDLIRLKNNLRLSRIFVFDGNIEKLTEFIQDSRADLIINLAANTKNTELKQNLTDIIDANINLPIQVMESMAATDTNLLICTGTFWEYDNFGNCSPNSLYAASKAASHSFYEYYTKRRGLKIISLVLFDTYGKSDPRLKLLQLLNNCELTGETLMLTPGYQKVDMVHISDVVDAYLHAATLLLNGSRDDPLYKTYAVCTGRRVTIRELVGIYSKVRQVKLNVKWDAKPYREFEIMEPVGVLENLPDWEAKVCLEEGIKSVFGYQFQLEK